MKKPQIVLVYPRSGNVELGPPLGFGYLKSNTDSNKYDINIIDFDLENLDPEGAEFTNRIKQINPGIVGVFSYSFNFTEALTIVKTVKIIDSHIATIIGGPHATVAAEKVIKNKEIDFVFRGEGEFSFSLFLEQYNNPHPDFSKVKGLAYKNKNGEYIFNEISRIKDLDSIKIPDYDVINLNRYIEKGYGRWYQNSKKRCAPIFTTRGCPYRCTFCAVPLVSGSILRKHSTEYMISWIKVLYTKYDIRGFAVFDDNFTFDIEYAKTLCKEVIKLGYKDVEFNSPNGIRMQRSNVELWDLMRRAGWRRIVVAPESGSIRILKSMKKDLEPKDVIRITKDIKKAGLKVHGFFIMGFPGETIDDLDQTKFLIRKCKFDGISITKFQPFPGTPIYNELLQKKEITNDFLPELFGDYKSTAYVTPTLRDFNFGNYVRSLRGETKTFLEKTKELFSCKLIFSLKSFHIKICTFFRKLL